MMDRQFTLFREQVRGLKKKLDFMIEANKLTMSLLGADPRHIERIAVHLKSKVIIKDSAQNSMREEEPSKEEQTINLDKTLGESSRISRVQGK